MIISLLTKVSTFKYFLATYSSSNTSILFLRKARLFVKSRYSRNRQWSKSIVYFGLWFNIISVIWVIYYCYRYIFIFSHLYWLGAGAIAVAAIRTYKSINVSKLSSWVRNLTWAY